MPLYEYQCGQCGRFELIRKFADPKLTVCPTCGQEVNKLPSAPAIQFKGTGWYITDYARKSSGGGESAKSGESSKNESSTASSGKETSSTAATASKGSSTGSK